MQHSSQFAIQYQFKKMKIKSRPLDPRMTQADECTQKSFGGKAGLRLKANLKSFVKKWTKKSGRKERCTFSVDGRTKKMGPKVFLQFAQFISQMNTICLGSDDPHSFVLSLCDEWTLGKNSIIFSLSTVYRQNIKTGMTQA